MNDHFFLYKIHKITPPFLAAAKRRLDSLKRGLKLCDMSFFMKSIKNSNLLPGIIHERPLIDDCACIEREHLENEIKK